MDFMMGLFNLFQVQPNMCVFSKAKHWIGSWNLLLHKQMMMGYREDNGVLVDAKPRLEFCKIEKKDRDSSSKY